jgi:choline dehydrogenase-like flavoprotein
VVESGPALGAPREARARDLDVYSSNGPLDYPLGATRFRGAGGTSNLWSGSCPRFHPIDFEPNAHTPRDAPWPIRYDELEPYYLGAEVELQVRGVEVAPNTPPRSAPFPRPMAPSFPNLEEVLRRRGLDLALFRLPRSDGQAGQGVRIASTHLPELAASPNATVVSDLTATRIEHGRGGRVDGIRLESFTQPPRVARARAYVIACGGVESARLLLLSGIGNRSDQVGRNFMEHPLVVRGTGTIEADWPLKQHSEWLCTEEFLLDAKRRGLGGVRIRLVADLHKDPPAAGLPLAHGPR